MTEDEYRQLALSLPEAAESSHMRHPDFRVRGKIFATLSPNQSRGVVLLTREQQEILTVSGGSPAPAPRSARGGVPVLFRTLCPLHATAASTTPAAITAATHVRAAIARIGSVRCWSLARWPLGAPGKRQCDE